MIWFRSYSIENRYLRRMVHRERPSSKHIMLKRNASHDSWIEGEREKPIESIDRRQQTRARSPKKGSEDSSR